MPLTNEQATEIKKQLKEQISNQFPADKKQQAIDHLENLSNDELEQFLIQNGLIGEDGKPTQKAQGQGCIFCSIAKGETPSFKVAENDVAVAVLEINPITIGHSLVIPRKHIEKVEDLPEEAFELAKQVARKIKEKNLKQNDKAMKDIKLLPANLFGHSIINILPIFNDEDLNTQRSKAPEDKLEKMQKLYYIEPKPKELEKVEKPKPKKLDTKNLRWPKRIP